MSTAWPETVLEDVLVPRQERPSDEDLISGRVRIVSKISFDDGQIRFRGDGETKTGMILVQPGDLLVSGINAYKGAIGVFDSNAAGPAAATIHYSAYRVRQERVDTRFLWYLLRSEIFRTRLERHVPGGIKTELKPSRLLPVSIPLPSLPEQQRIVARIERVMAKVDEARKLRQTVEEEMEALEIAATATAFKDSSPMVRVGEFVDRENLTNGKSVRTTGEDSEIHCLTLSSLRLGRIDCTDTKPVPIDARDAERFLVRHGDVFVVRGNGSKELVGRSATVENPPPGVIFPDLFIRVPLNENKIRREFFVAAWNGSQTRKLIEECAKTTSGIWKINQSHIASIPIPLPDLDEQDRVVSYLRYLQQKSERLKSTLLESSAEVAALMPAVLGKAFTGEL